MHLISVLRTTIVLLLLCVPALPLHAHKVNLFAWVEEGTVHTESYFPDGKEVRYGEITVFDSQENLLLTGTTDSKGLFSFPIPERDDLTIVLDASMGHRTTYKLTAGELGSGLAPKASSTPEEMPIERLSSTEHPRQALSADEETTVTLEEIRMVVQEEIARQTEPLSAKLSRIQQDNRVTVHEVFAGIGYILGLMGLVLFFKSKVKR